MTLNLFETIAEGVKIRRRCQLYEEGEKSTVFFLILERKKTQSVKALVRKLEMENKFNLVRKNYLML